MLDDDKSLESGEPKKDFSKEKKTSKGYAGTVQDTEWRIPEEPKDCSREDICYWNRVKGDYE